MSRDSLSVRLVSGQFHEDDLLLSFRVTSFSMLEIREVIVLFIGAGIPPL